MSRILELTKNIRKRRRDTEEEIAEAYRNLERNCKRQLDVEENLILSVIKRDGKRVRRAISSENKKSVSLFKRELFEQGLALMMVYVVATVVLSGVVWGVSFTYWEEKKRELKAFHKVKIWRCGKAETPCIVIDPKRPFLNIGGRVYRILFQTLPQHQKK